MKLFKYSALVACGLLLCATHGSAQQRVRVLVAYHSVTGNTEKMAHAVAEGARAPNVSVELKKVADVTRADLEQADALIVGSPTQWSNMTSAMKAFIETWPDMVDRIGGAFATGGAASGGKEHVVTSLVSAMLSHGMVVAGPVYTEGAFRFGASGATATTGPGNEGVSEAELNEARTLGERIARLAARIEPVRIGTASSPSPSHSPSPSALIRVLFIGNSLTYQNDLPRVVQSLGVDPVRIEAEMVAAPNLALIDHVNGASDAIARIRERRWDFVVLQQGPTSIVADRDTLILAVRALDREIRAAGARTAIYMVWPAKDRLAYFDNVHAAYKTAAEAVGAVFIPAGDAWRRAWRTDAKLALYGADDFHPSALGTQLAALTIYECLTQRAPAASGAIPDAAARAAHEAAATCLPQEHAKASTDAGMCALGHEQSPIDLRDAVPADLPDLEFNYHVANAEVVDLHHAIQATFKDSLGLRIGDVDYRLLQFHYHHPSEHTIGGRVAPLEVHLVHADAHGKLAVVGVRFVEGSRPNPALARMLQEIGRSSLIDPETLLPAKRGYFTYAGSLTTPPCSEGVRWVVLKEPMTATREQIEALRGEVEPNARPLQKLEKRVLRQSDEK
jgi:carbonic anhydrase